MHVRSFTRLALAILIPLAVAACGSDSTGPGGSSGGDAVPTVSSGLTPSISWSGANARNITVTLMENGQPTTSMWMVNANNPTGGFSGPVTYGQLPSGTAQLAPAAPLQAGATYRVTLALVDNKGGFRDITR